jgi:hypothetical protein
MLSRFQTLLSFNLRRYILEAVTLRYNAVDMMEEVSGGKR